MTIDESNLTFEFDENTQAIKFDDTDFYRKYFNKMPGSKGVDILANSKESIQFIEIKNCTGNERENIWRTSVNNSKIDAAPCELDVENRDSLDVEVSKKVAATISCLYGAHTKMEQSENALQMNEYWKELVDTKILKDKKQLLVILYFEGDFDSHLPKSRSKKMVMDRLQGGIESQLSWLKCKVMVVDKNTYSKRYFKVS